MIETDKIYKDKKGKGFWFEKGEGVHRRHWLDGKVYNWRDSSAFEEMIWKGIIIETEFSKDEGDIFKIYEAL